MSQTIRVATWNIGSLYTDYDRNLAYLQRMITEQKPDILCMQEFPRREELFQKVCAWGDFPGYLFHTTSISHICTENHMGVAVFSRFPLTQLEVFKLTKPTVEIFYKGRQEYWHDKYFMAVSCQIGERPVLMVTGHGFPFHRYDLENEASRPIIQPSFTQLDGWFCGLAERFSLPMLCAAADFNITAALPFMPQSAKKYRDVFQGDATRPFGRKTDGILIGENVRLKEKINIYPPEDVYDHHFILADLEI